MDSFEDHLSAAIDEIMHYQTADDRLINTGTLAATLIAQGVVADPVQHQQDLTAIMDRQVRESEAWRDEYVTSATHPDAMGTDHIADVTRPAPDWNEYMPTYRRRVTDWQEVHRA